MTHKWVFTGVDTHRGEYWYKCSQCGESDWIASYGTMDQLMPKECKSKDSDEIERLRAALHEIAEEWAGAECGEPVTAQEAYAIDLARRMGRMAAEARDGHR